jgi:hypothetical protein
MAHRRVEGEGLRTTYAFAPRVRPSTVRDAATTIQLDFASSAIYADDQELRVTQLCFEHVVSYDWNDFEYHRLPCNPEDAEFALIEIINSPVVADIRSTGRYIGESIHHFRISFDDHGTYDVVCEKVGISYSHSFASELYG